MISLDRVGFGPGRRSILNEHDGRFVPFSSQTIIGIRRDGAIMMRQAHTSATERASDRRRILKWLAFSSAAPLTGWSPAGADDSPMTNDAAGGTKVAAVEASLASIPRTDRPQALPADELKQASATTLDEALEIISESHRSISQVQDYVCDFVKQERVGGSLLKPQLIRMKARTNPHCIYFSFQTVHQGREAIYHPARFSDKIIAHEGGWKGYLAGTMHLDPTGRMAMSDNRHPVSQAGLDKMITRIHENWHRHLQPHHVVRIERGVMVDNRSTTMVQTRHGRREDEFEYHVVQVYFDDEHRLPIRFVGYDWPHRTGESPMLVEDYRFRNLRLNVGLSDRDFDPKNPAYKFQ